MRRKLTLIDAQKKGGQCLSECYINNKSPLHWECVKFHEWKAALCDIKRGTVHNVQDVLSLILILLKKLHLKKGGICLSEKYINSYIPLFWQCAKKYEWQAPLEIIILGALNM